MVAEQELKRFGFGANWASFSDEIDEERFEQAICSLKNIFGLDTLENKRFLDLGCGSGLFSLAAASLGAQVVSIDYDPQSVSCAEKLKANGGSLGDRWEVQQGSVLDPTLIDELGKGDLVYCWGVVHHTGKMREAIANVASLVNENGLLCLAIYNDQGGASKRWLKTKQTYNALPSTFRPAFAMAVAAFYELRFSLARLTHFKNPLPFSDWKKKKSDRGMSVWHDWVDWIGGLPFEVAKPDEIVALLRSEGFILEKLKTVGNGWGCNEFLFSRETHAGGH
ncbi:MAG: methyltransferase [Rubripirellula sp.]|nr:methyltransferase [Rubripirellula sp.]